MLMAPRLRKAALTAHVVCSVGWLGATAAFLALSVTGLLSSSPDTVRSAYIAADIITWLVIVPLGAASLATGVIQSLGTTWGLFRHYWVLIKLLLTVAAALLLLLHTKPIAYVAHAAATITLGPGDLRSVRMQLVFDASLALAALLVATTLSVFKPQGVTPHGYRRLSEMRPPQP
jgi:hypothetical protein